MTDIPPRFGGVFIGARMTDWNHYTPLAAANAYPQAMIPLRIEGGDPTNPALDSFEQVALATVIAAAVYGASGGQGASGQIGSIDLFANLAAHSLPGAATAFITGGCSAAGLGGGTYVADSLATSALAASCPRFCAADGAGRFFRLAAPGGAIAISQGGALGGANNDQRAVQAAIDYAKAIGCRSLLFDFDVVSIWNTNRTSAADGSAPDAQDGQALFVSAPIKFIGRPTQTHLKLLSTTGTSLETGWQNVGGNVWRGSGINLMGGTQGAPTTNNLTFFAMADIWLDGGCAYTGSNVYVTPSAPYGADLSNKGIRLQGTRCDNVTLTRCIISGFKGEAYYLAGTTDTVQTLSFVKIFGSNQSAFNPQTGFVKADNCEFGNSYLSAEILGCVGGSMTACKFYNSTLTGILGGQAIRPSYNYAYPSRSLVQAPPWFDLIDCEFINAGQFQGGNFVRIIRGRATDTSFYCSIGYCGGVLTSTYIDLDYTIDQANQNPIMVVEGAANLTTLIGGAPAGTFQQPVSDFHVKMNIHRTALAIANSHAATVVYALAGYFDQNSCSFAIGDADGVLAIQSPFGSEPLFAQPLVTCDGPSSSQFYGMGFAVNTHTMTAGPYAITVDSPRIALQNTGTAAAIACTMAAPYTAPSGFAMGQKARIYYNSTNTAGTTFTFARNGAGLRLNSDCTMAVAFDWIEVEFNGGTGLWHETGRSIHVA